MANERQQNPQKINISFSGFLYTEPILRYVSGGKPVCEFTVRYDTHAPGSPYNKTLWFRFTCWDLLAETVAQMYRKGSKINIVKAKPQADRWKCKKCGEFMEIPKWTIYEIDSSDLTGGMEERNDSAPEYETTGDDINDIPF